MPRTYHTEDHLRQELRKLLRGKKTQAQLAEEVGVTPSFLSMVLNGKSVTGKIVGFLGYRKVRVKMFEKVGSGKKL